MTRSCKECTETSQGKQNSKAGDMRICIEELRAFHPSLESFSSIENKAGEKEILSDKGFRETLAEILSETVDAETEGSNQTSQQVKSTNYAQLPE